MTQITTKELEKQINELQEYLNKYPSQAESAQKTDPIQEILNRAKKHMDEKTYNIAIVANMSAGKSTFINALFGEEILPSSHLATTDCATYIHSNRKNGAEKKAIIFFKNGRKLTLNQDQLGELHHYATKDEDTTEEKYKNVEKIELYYPFENIPDEEQKDDIKIFFVDTPGPNNQGSSSDKHKAQTQKALEDAHIALFLFDYTQIDANKKGGESKETESEAEKHLKDLWLSIKIQKQINPDLKVFFVINKIDEALDDASQDKTKTSKEAVLLAIKQRKEQELKNNAKDKGIGNIEVSFSAALPAEASRIIEKNPNDRRYKKIFKRFEEDFEEIYGENQNQARQNFMGINIIEEKINSHLKNEASEHLIKCVQNAISSAINLKQKNLKDRIENLKKPAQEAKNNIAKAKQELEAIQSQQAELENKLQDTQDKTLDRIQKTAKKYFNEAFNVNTIIQNLQDGLSETYSISFTAKQIIITADTEGQEERISQTINNLIPKILKERDAKLADSMGDISKEYRNHEKDIQHIIAEFKNKVEKIVNKAIDIKSNSLDNSTTQQDYSIRTNVSFSNIAPSISTSVTEKDSGWKKAGRGLTHIIEKGGMTMAVGAPLPLKTLGGILILGSRLIREFLSADNQYNTHIDKDDIRKNLNLTIEKAQNNFEKQIMENSQDTFQCLQNLAIQEAQNIINQQKDFMRQLENDLKDPEENLAEAKAQLEALNELEATKKLLKEA